MNNVIFIIGCGHSGTTLLNKILGHHQNIYSIDHETGIFAPHHKNNTNQKIIAKLTSLDMRMLCKKKWLCEKTPCHVYGIDKIFELINNPKIIVMIRDGRDVVASLYKRYDDFDLCINRWIQDNKQWLNSMHQNNFHVIKYEEFVKNPKIELHKICEFLGEEYDPNMLKYQKDKIQLPNNIFENKINGPNHNLLRLYQINQDIYDGSKRYLVDLTQKQLNILMSNDQFIQLMKQFNYI